MTSTVEPTPIDIAFDLEFSGPRINRHFVVSWAMVARNAFTRDIVSQKKVLFLKPQDKEWEPTCLEEFWKKDPELVKEVDRIEAGEIGKSVEEGTEEMVDWIHNVKKEHAGDDLDMITFLCDTTAVDSVWVNYYLSQIDHEPIQAFFGKFKDVVNTSSYAMGAAALHTGDICIQTKKRGRFSENRELRRIYDVPADKRPKTKHDHDPLNDCKSMFEEFDIHHEYANAAVECYNGILNCNKALAKASEAMNSLRASTRSFLVLPTLPSSHE